jgi:hypothetical protein
MPYELKENRRRFVERITDFYRMSCVMFTRTTTN